MSLDRDELVRMFAQEYLRSAELRESIARHFVGQQEGDTLGDHIARTAFEFAEAFMRQQFRRNPHEHAYRYDVHKDAMVCSCGDVSRR